MFTTNRAAEAYVILVNKQSDKTTILYSYVILDFIATIFLFVSLCLYLIFFLFVNAVMIENGIFTRLIVFGISIAIPCIFFKDEQNLRSAQALHLLMKSSLYKNQIKE